MLPARGDHSSLTKRLGCQGGMVSRWARGLTKPGWRWRIALQKQMGIPVEAWEIDPLLTAEETETPTGTG
jgi:hypothetical protein